MSKRLLLYILLIFTISYVGIQYITINNSKKIIDDTKNYKVLYIGLSYFKIIEKKLNNYYELGYIVVAMNNKYILLEKVEHIENNKE